MDVFPKTKRAANETRTRDPNLGKVVLYQLSYCRITIIKHLYWMVKRRRLELPRRNWHYPLKVARLPIPPPLHHVKQIEQKKCPEQDSNLHASRHTHLKRARLPIPPPGHFLRLKDFLSNTFNVLFIMLSGKRDSNSRPQPWQGCALPTELLPPFQPVSSGAFL